MWVTSRSARAQPHRLAPHESASSANCKPEAIFVKIRGGEFRPKLRTPRAPDFSTTRLPPKAKLGRAARGSTPLGTFSKRVDRGGSPGSVPKSGHGGSLGLSCPEFGAQSSDLNTSTNATDPHSVDKAAFGGSFGIPEPRTSTSST